MPHQKPSIGRIVHYKISESDAADINRRRTDSASIKERIIAKLWPTGAQAHIGSDVYVGDHLPMIITSVVLDQYGPGKHCVSGQVFLNGTDSYWVIYASEGNDNGNWHWPELT